MGILHIIWYLITGFIVGLIARAIIPGADTMGIVMTTLLGIVGSLVGGVIGGLVSKPKEGAKFHPAGLILSVIGAIIVLFLYNQLR
ncbi:MAG TPA: GlsB/YeaQ/YmgE family stress response membrane protein [Thermoanaerobaculaceae bacterium]|nr:GlsB/YeaQ/YmgE family stress response membrane protein [Thermoanaerobaculaceae bacterium]